MKLLSKLSVLGLLLSSLIVSTSARAEIWIDDLTIKEVKAYYDGSYRLKVVVNEPTNTGCANEVQSTFLRTEGTIHSHTKHLLSLLQQAVASNTKVDLAYMCAAGYGNVLYGVGLEPVD